MKRTFDRDGYIIIRNLLSQSEVEKATKVVECNETMKRFKFGVKDTHGNESAQITWNQPGNDVTGLIARCDKVSGTAEKLLGGECYHYHSKVVLKDPLAGGERAWHQDYGYWYQNGCLFPDMLTVFITLDKTDQSNGCLQLLRGSHQCGRIEHTLVGAETGAKMERVNELLKKCPLDFIETEPGDGVFFHCNLLHMSAVNASNRRRLAFLVAYNKASNNPVKEHHHPQYTPLKKVPDVELEHCDVLDDMNGKSFLDMENSKTLKDQTSFKKRQ
ncbi:L-proline trans-4-hydroxylase-like [Saccostrea cucullata]|uniref:L-proline trans-4-hydroxylase-like n=1 Tax=Saccostrea cuccullata TaxID=36930 RepID=UPI002ED043C0